MSLSALIIDDDPGIRQSVRLCLEAGGAKVLGVATAAGALEALDRAKFDVVFLDLWLGSDSGKAALPEILRKQPDAGVIVITAYASIQSAVDAMRSGAVDYLPKPFTPDQVRLAADRVQERLRLAREVTELQSQVREAEGEITFDTASAAFRAFMELARRAAQSDTTVLLRGESGTGKNVLARWLRQQGLRKHQPLVTVHCPMLGGSCDAVSSELFGYRKGVFPGAKTDAGGRVEEAAGGTLVLDEVAELPADAQSRLLRFLEDHSYQRVGETKSRNADVRVIAITNRPLERLIQDSAFREDLFYRLNVLALEVPPLRQRAEDILPLAHRYLAYFRARQGRRGLKFSAECERALLSYTWPGNLREMRNLIERAVVLADRDLIETRDIGLSPKASPLSGTAGALPLGADCSLEDIEREHIARTLARIGSPETCAKVLGIDPTTLQRKRKRYGLS